MPTPPTTICLDRAGLARAVRELPLLDLRVLMYLLLEASPYSGRVWHPLSRLAEDLGVRDDLVKAVLERLAALDFIEQHPPWIRNVLAIDLGPLLVRGAPEDLPVGSGAP